MKTVHKSVPKIVPIIFVEASMSLDLINNLSHKILRESPWGYH